MSPSSKARKRRSKSMVQWEPVYVEDSAFTLTSDVKGELAEIAGVTDDARREHMCADVRRVLSRYPSMTTAVDKAPRAPSINRDLKERLVAADRLCRGLRAGPDPLSWELTREGFHFHADVEDLVAGLDRFVRAGQRVQRRLARQEGRHGPTRQAFRATMQKLSCLFDFYFEGDERDRKKLKVEFVKNALDAAQIPTGKCDPLKTKAPSRCRFVRDLPPVCPGCLAAGQGQELAKDLVWQQMETLAKKRSTRNPELSVEDAVAEVLGSKTGERLYALYVSVGTTPLNDIRRDPKIKRLLAKRAKLDATTSRRENGVGKNLPA